MIIIALKLRNLQPRAFEHIEPFERFAQQLSRRPSLPVELIANQFIMQRDCLDVFLLLWIASALQAIAHSDFVLDIDLLATDLNTRNTTSTWLNSVGCSIDFSDCSLPTSTVLHIHSPAFERAVKDAASALQSRAAPLLITRPEALQHRLRSISSVSQWVLKMATGDG